MILAGATRIGVIAPVLVLDAMAAATIASLLRLSSPTGEARRIGLAPGAKPGPFFQGFAA
jgi:hypothetical protein